jgi:hypothetical protein
MDFLLDAGADQVADLANDVSEDDDSHPWRLRDVHLGNSKDHCPDPPHDPGPIARPLSSPLLL